MRHHHHRAETLLEVIVSLGVLMITLGYSGSLIASATSQIASNQNHIIASNLAKEGIEVVRNIIGTNLFRLKSDIENCWNAGFIADPISGELGQIINVENCDNKLGGAGTPVIGTSYYFRLFFDPSTGRFTLEEESGLENFGSLTKDSISYLPEDCVNSEVPCITPADISLASLGIILDSSNLYRGVEASDDATTVSTARFFRIVEIKYHDISADGAGDVMQVISHVFFRQSGEFREVRFGTLITPFEI